jgi:hypothetical protein
MKRIAAKVPESNRRDFAIFFALPRRFSPIAPGKMFPIN